MAIFFNQESLTYNNGVPVPAGISPLVVSGITVPAGGHVIVAYSANVTEVAQNISDGSIESADPGTAHKEKSKA